MEERVWLKQYDKGVPHTLQPYPAGTLLDLVGDTARQRPGHPALVLGRGTPASGALSRSWALTRGSRWRIFGMLVTIFLLLYIPIVALTAIAALVLPDTAPGSAMTGGRPNRNKPVL